MAPESFAQMARGALTLAGVPFEDGDLEVLGAVAQALDPGMRALDLADPGELPLESGLDPARAPRTSPGPDPAGVAPAGV